jgi:hypothetical protein
MSTNNKVDILKANIVQDVMNQNELRKYQCEEFNKNDNIVLIAMHINEKKPLSIKNYSKSQ